MLGEWMPWTMRRMAASCEQQVSNCGCSTAPIGKMGCEIVSTATGSGCDLAIDVRGEGSFQPKGAVVARMLELRVSTALLKVLRLGHSW